jgi:divalent metal cation (Fe/Co/Zn/Cd) transporter
MLHLKITEENVRLILIGIIWVGGLIAWIFLSRKELNQNPINKENIYTVGIVVGMSIVATPLLFRYLWREWKKTLSRIVMVRPTDALIRQNKSLV